MNSPVPLAGSIVAAERLRIGGCEIDVALREVRASGARKPVRITPKSMAVLLVLVEHQGEVVTREVLFSRVWPNTWPSNDVLTQAITQLRKALGEQRAETRYIETISKSGYRLLASVEALPAKAKAGIESVAVAADAPMPSSSPDVQAIEAAVVSSPEPTMPSRTAKPFRRGWPAMRPSGWLAAGGLLLLAGLLVVGIAAFKPGSGTAGGTGGVIRAPQLPYRLLTSATGFEGEAALSPDASQVAYMALPDGGMEQGTRIMVQTTGQSQPRLLVPAADGTWDRLPAWSPNGREIAFVRHLPNGQCRIMGVSANGGVARELLVCDGVHAPSFDWGPDSRSLIVSSRTSPVSTAGLQLYDIAAGRWHPIPYGAHARDDDHTPRYSPDGQWIAFLRNAPLGDIWRIPAAGGVAERLTTQHAELRGLSWTADSRGLVFGRRIDGQSRLYHLDIDSGAIRDLGVDDAKSPSVARRQGVLAFTQRKPQFGIYRLDLLPVEGASTLPRAERVFASSGRDTLPSVSPDGRQILFASDRSGDFGLWWAELDNPASLRRIEGIHPDSRLLANWAEDGSRALELGIDDAGRHGLFEIQPRSGQVTLLSLPLPAGSLVLSGSYLPGTARMLVLSLEPNGRQVLQMMEPHGNGWQVLTAIQDVTSVKVDARHGRIFFTRTGEDGLWEAGLALQSSSIRQISHEYPRSRDYRDWALTSDGHVEYLQAAYPCTARLRHLALGRSFIRPRCLQRERRASHNGFSIDPRNHELYVPLASSDGADIGFMTLSGEMARELRPDPKSLFTNNKLD